jgi:hypothetical protein
MAKNSLDLVGRFLDPLGGIFSRGASTGTLRSPLLELRTGSIFSDRFSEGRISSLNARSAAREGEGGMARVP